MKNTRLQLVFTTGKKFESSIFTVILGILMGIGWISLIIWNRLIRERLPRDLTLTVRSILYFGTLFRVNLFIWFSCGLVASIYGMYKKFRGIEKPLRLTQFLATKIAARPKLENFLQYVLDYILNAPWFLWRFMIFNLPTEIVRILGVILKKTFLPLQNALTNFDKDHIRKKVITWVVLVYLPRILGFTIFAYDIGINKYIYYFYYFAPILLIPVMMKVIRRIMFEYAHFYFYRKNLIENIEFLEVKEIHEDCWTYVMKAKDIPENEEGKLLCFALVYNL